MDRRRWVALATLLVAEAMNLLDATIVQVAAPAIHAELGGSSSDIQWFAAAYTLPFAMLLITGGRLGDMAGRRRIFRIGVAGFVLASLACALAPSAPALIVERAVQGAAAALVIPQTFGLIRRMFEGPELSRALGSIGPVMALALVCGPVLGGVLTQANLFGSSWRSVFLVNVPLGAAALAGARLFREDRAARPPRLDLAGTGLAVLGAGLVVYPLIEGNTAGWPAWTWGSVLAGIVVLGLFGLHQRRKARSGRSPLVEASLFEGRRFPAALASSTLFFAVMNGLMLVVVLQVELGLRAGARAGGLTLLPWACAAGLASWLAGARLVPRVGNRIMFAGLAALAVGVLGATAGYASAASAPATAYPWPVLPALAVCGLGQGLFTTSFFTASLRPVRPHETGSAAGLLNAVQQLGGTLGIALLGSVFLHVFADPGGSAVGAAALRGAADTFCVAAGLLAASAGTVAVMAWREEASPAHRIAEVIDEGTEFGARVARRLREEMVVWLTTVTPGGAPLPRPVGFVWDGGEVVSIYSQPGARVRNIAANPKVTLNFDGDAAATSSSSRASHTSTPTAPARTRTPRTWRSTPLRSSGSG